LLVGHLANFFIPEFRCNEGKDRCLALSDVKPSEIEKLRDHREQRTLDRAGKQNSLQENLQNYSSRLFLRIKREKI